MSELEPEADAARERAAASEMKYPNVVAAISEKPWAILPRTLAVIVDLVSYRARGHRLTQAEVAERIDEGRTQAAARRQAAPVLGSVAVLPLYGVIAPRAAQLNNVSGPSGTGCDAFAQMFRQALADPAVGSILIDADTPGGRVDGVPELADEIRAARGKKPIVGISNTMCGSAGYWILSQCDEVVVTPSGEVGSVGVYCAHEDLSAALEQEGVKITLISAGKFKTEGNPFEPLSEEALAAIQADVDAYYSMFVAAVAKGRGVAVDDVKSGFGQGRMVMAKDAVRAGMADRVATFDDTVQRLARGDTPAGKKSAGRTIDVEIVADASQLQAALVNAYVAANLGALAKVGIAPTDALGMTIEELEAAVLASKNPEGGSPSNLTPVPGAERLFRHRAVREAFTPGPTD
jgi:signal peptide peptidase SppA